MTSLAFFAAPGGITRIGEHEDLLAGPPTDVPSLVRVVQGALIH